MIFDPTNPFVHPAQLEWTDVYVPEPVADFLEADAFTREGMGNAAPTFLPADPAIAADQADFKVLGVFQRSQLPRQRAHRGLIVRGGCLLIEGFMGALVVVLVTKTD